MPLSGEAIRLMNYIDDVAVTLRRILSTIPTLSDEERFRVAEHLLHASPNADDVAHALAAKAGAGHQVQPLAAKPAPLA
jgi:hypothetical protein